MKRELMLSPLKWRILDEEGSENGVKAYPAQDW